jgi:hypothetical protein
MKVYDIIFMLFIVMVPRCDKPRIVEYIALCMAMETAVGMQCFVTVHDDQAVRTERNRVIFV